MILTTMMMTMLLGFTALVIDGSYMYEQRNRLAAAADAAAKAAAQELARHSSISLPTLQTFAEHEVSLHGFTPGGTMSVAVNHPPSAGAFAANSNYVEVIASRQAPTFFARLLGFVSVTPGARAVAGKSTDANCMVALSTSGVAIHVGGSGLLAQPGCAIAANSDLFVGNSGSVTAAPVSITGVCSGAGCPGGAHTGAALTPDPLALLAAPSNPGSCSALSIGNNGSGTATAGCYSSVAVGGGGNLTFGAGNYYVTGDITFGNNSTINGTGVSIYLTGAASGISLGGASNLTLSAPTSGTYAGIVFFQDRSDATLATFNNNTVVTLSGTLYVPNAEFNLGGGGNLTSTDCSIIVAKTVTLNNSTKTTLKNTCAAFGGSPLKTITIAE